MIRQILAVAVGFILWSAGWLFYNGALRKFTLLPADLTQPIGSGPALAALLTGSCVLSLLAGFLVAAIARTSIAPGVISLGVLLLAVGLFFQIQFWRLMPLWYHFSFLVLLIPLCLLGAWLRGASR
jgi:hypothetical protein